MNPERTIATVKDWRGISKTLDRIYLRGQSGDTYQVLVKVTKQAVTSLLYTGAKISVYFCEDATTCIITEIQRERMPALDYDVIYV